MRNRYQEELKALNDDIVKLANKVDYSIRVICSMIEKYQQHLEALDTIASIKEDEREIESKCMKLILLEQPIAKDLRYISSSLKMVTDLKRIVDQCVDIKELMSEKENISYLLNKNHFITSANIVREMTSEAIKAYINHDISKARELRKQDDIIDQLFLKVQKDIIQSLKSDEDSAASLLNILMIAKHIEKIGDHVVNICNWTEFNVTGKIDSKNMFE